MRLRCGASAPPDYAPPRRQGALTHRRAVTMRRQDHLKKGRYLNAESAGLSKQNQKGRKAESSNRKITKFTNSVFFPVIYNNVRIIMDCLDLPKVLPNSPNKARGQIQVNNALRPRSDVNINVTFTLFGNDNVEEVH